MLLIYYGNKAPVQENLRVRVISSMYLIKETLTGIASTHP